MTALKIRGWRVKGAVGLYGVFRAEDVNGKSGDLSKLKGKNRPQPIVSGLNRQEAIRARRKLFAQTGLSK